MSSVDANDTITVQEYISHQDQLESEALEALPYDPKDCTYTLGPLRQQLYACLTCFQSINSSIDQKPDKDGPDAKFYNAICYSCSIKCHSTHHLIPLYTKRSFQCDCGTTRIPSTHPCNLRKVTKDLANDDNRYNVNFEGKFCDCERMYDEEEGEEGELVEQGTMIQCLLGDVCGEDWFHEGCILGLRNCVPDYEEGDKRDIPDSEHFEGFICWKCVGKWCHVMDEIKLITDVVLKEIERVATANGIKERNQLLDTENEVKESPEEEPASKRRKLKEDTIIPSSLFLKHNFKSKLKLHRYKSPDLNQFLTKFPHMLNDDPVYEPPLDTQTSEAESLEVMNSLPREKAIEGIMAYNDIKDKVKDFLKGFTASSGSDGELKNGVVTKEDVLEFFEGLKKQNNRSK